MTRSMLLLRIPIRLRAGRALCCALGLSLFGLACPAGKTGAPVEKLPPCTEFGQRCEFSPGKFGSCVQRDDCHEQNCFVCQSQH